MRLNRRYIQKSHLFLYPCLSIENFVEVKPITTYIAIDDSISIDDNMLICVYHKTDALESNKRYFNILKNYVRSIDINDTLIAVVFRIDENTFESFLGGRYSSFDRKVKEKILTYYKDHEMYEHVYSFLHPEIYIPKYSRMLKVKECILKEIGELCSVLDIEKETLVIDRVCDVVENITEVRYKPKNSIKFENNN